MAALALQPRVTIRSGATVERLLVERDRCAGVVLDEGEVRADATVLAAGSWSSLVPGVPAAVPAVRPVRGQMVLLDERPPRLRTIVFGAGGYVVPRGDGRVLCGSTMEHVGFRKEVTAAGVHAILASALASVPSLAAAQLGGTWSNFRPHAEERRARGRVAARRGSSSRPATTATASCSRRSPPGHRDGGHPRPLTRLRV